jgi:hypothetical protein
VKTINQIGTVFFTDNMVSVTTERVRSALEASNLDPMLARDLSKRYCFTRAKNRMQADGLIDEIDETPDRWTWQLSRRFREAEHLGYEFDSAFWFDKLSQGVGADSNALLERVRELFASYGGLYLPSDLTKVIRRIFERQKGMVPLRHSGAIYFVPAENRILMNRVAAFIKDLGGDCITADIGADNAPIRDKAQEMLVESVRKDLDGIVNELRELSADGDTLSARKAGSRWKELLVQLDRIKTFARSLNADTSDLLRKARNSELDLALVANADLDVIAALAHAGKINSALGQIAMNAFSGELPPLSSTRVRAALPPLDFATICPDAVLPCVAAHQPVLLEV